ncbi:MAG: carbohydrate kinase [Candidatus Thiodiazotropha sp. (ex Myrtea sp. 'scaly one' KF741663)]|nr:carbohydrate kinase [Candidatus Thiodiazotropha sp. (ex Myrtea sp. 'scaly one' KF741663)]
MEGVTVFGEVLFDCFPTGEKVLGGAPFNVAWHLQAFAQCPRFISCVGKDASGDTIRRAMQGWGMDTNLLQTHASKKTGEVQITLQDGEPTYDIVDQVAYDYIDASSLADAPHGVLYHGSLALRHEVSRQALEKLKSQHPSAVFMDVNLREPWWQRDLLLAWVDGADWVKLNEAEFSLLHGGASDPKSAAEAFLQQHHLSGLIVTRGAQGAMAVMPGQPPVEVAPVKALEVVDTVGAGDALSSVLLLGLNLAWPIRQTLERAQGFASALVGRRGATVEDIGFYRPFIDAWKL